MELCPVGPPPNIPNTGDRHLHTLSQNFPYTHRVSCWLSQAEGSQVQEQERLTEGREVEIAELKEVSVAEAGVDTEEAAYREHEARYLTSLLAASGVEGRWRGYLLRLAEEAVATVLPDLSPGRPHKPEEDEEGSSPVPIHDTSALEPETKTVPTPGACLAAGIGRLSLPAGETEFILQKPGSGTEEVEEGALNHSLTE